MMPRNKQHAPTNNPVAIRNLYPGAAGSTVGAAGSAQTPSSTENMNEVVPNEDIAMAGLTKAFKISVAGQPVASWIGLVVLLLGLMWLARKTGQAGDFGNLKLSIYNIGVITLAGIVGGSILKVLAVRYPIPGVSTVILAS